MFYGRSIGILNMIYWILIILISLTFIPRTCYGYMGAAMGVAQQSCDDGKTNLIVDWDYSFSAYSCVGVTKWKSNSDIAPLYYTIPNFNARKDQVWHYCMNTSILYKDRPPIRGHHRPLWAKYGEYLYVPPQRWLHNLEHGSIVMLYHPCADEEQIHKLRQLVTSCMWRHVITPYDKLSNDRPFALLAWGAKLEMNTVDLIQSVLFMRKHAHVAPEDISKEGQYDEMLLRPAAIVTDKDDSIVCPWVPTTNINVDSNSQQSAQLSRNMLFGTVLNTNQISTNPNPIGKFENRQARLHDMMPPTIAQGKWVLIDPTNRKWQKRSLSNPKMEKDLQRNRRTFIDVVNLAEKYNGPKFVPDVLPPSAILQMYEQPNYVVAGSNLGNNPLKPNTIANGGGPQQGPSLAVAGQAMPGPGQMFPIPMPSPPNGSMMGPPTSNAQLPPIPPGASSNANMFQNPNFGTNAGINAPGSGANPAQVLAAMAMLMRKDAPPLDNQQQFQQSINNFDGTNFPQQQQQSPTQQNSFFDQQQQSNQNQNYQMQAFSQMPQKPPQPQQPQPANFFVSASDPRQMQQFTPSQWQQNQNRNQNAIWARTTNSYPEMSGGNTILGNDAYLPSSVNQPSFSPQQSQFNNGNSIDQQSSTDQTLLKNLLSTLMMTQQNRNGQQQNPMQMMDDSSYFPTGRPLAGQQQMNQQSPMNNNQLQMLFSNTFNQNGGMNGGGGRRHRLKKNSIKAK